MGCFLVVILMRLKNDFSKRCPIIIVTRSIQQAARVSQRNAFFRLREIAEYGETGKKFSDPRKKRTQAYNTNRIG